MRYRPVARLARVPPEAGCPGWVTPAPYQRWVRLDFGQDPTGLPGSGIPGAVYQGTDDDLLKVSDFVELTGPMQWLETSGTQTRTGFVGFEGVGSAGVVVHLDNWLLPRPVKHYYLRIEYGAAGVGDASGALLLPPGCGMVDAGMPYYNPGQENGMDWYTVIQYIVIAPNPEWEDFVFGAVMTTAESVFLVDSIEIATECVPEPATMGLLALGGLTLLVRRRHA